MREFGAGTLSGWAVYSACISNDAVALWRRRRFWWSGSVCEQKRRISSSHARADCHRYPDGVYLSTEMDFHAGKKKKRNANRLCCASQDKGHGKQNSDVQWGMFACRGCSGCSVETLERREEKERRKDGIVPRRSAVSQRLFWRRGWNGSDSSPIGTIMCLLQTHNLQQRARR